MLPLSTILYWDSNSHEQEDGSDCRKVNVSESWRKSNSLQGRGKSPSLWSSKSKGRRIQTTQDNDSVPQLMLGIILNIINCNIAGMSKLACTVQSCVIQIKQIESGSAVIATSLMQWRPSPGHPLIEPHMSVGVTFVGEDKVWTMGGSTRDVSHLQCKSLLLAIIPPPPGIYQALYCIRRMHFKASASINKVAIVATTQLQAVAALKS